jgi:23S rRNA pseudouridine1911/1915/1917 synthase
VAIATGRTHQIRVHLSAIGHPVVGDATYGGVHRRIPGHLRALGRLARPFLHAWRLAFTHPGDGRRLAFEAPLPLDLESVLDELRAAVAGGRLGGRPMMDHVTRRRRPRSRRGRIFAVHVDRVRCPTAAK